ncbi:hypothetical protein FHT09_001655 [Xanthomonas arboricola]|uniref:hypothetical protein n=1 Tax=Xanthomonas TaxID=338 RepID=UPI000CEF049B|nr:MULTISPECIES: hypothetical protein [Xanthomonas]MBB5735915.1 hypothetical protein [Xanthomonas sp. CFBP 8152]PPT81621.1 hypothetical protein XarbCFBP8152_01115 [Xanthomonas arboricola]
MTTDYRADIARLRETIGQLKEQIESLADGLLPKERALARMESSIETAAAKVRTNVYPFTRPDDRDRVDPIPHGADGVFAYLCRIVPDAVRAHLTEELEAVYAKAPVQADDKKRAKLERELLKAEQDEERLISAAAEQGVRISRRADVNPAVLLGL